MMWTWDSPKGYLQIENLPKDIVSKNERSGFSFWVYNKIARKDSLKVVLAQDKDNYYTFNFGLDFTGWRTAWVMFHRDMQVKGKPNEINTVKILPPKSVAKGTLFLQDVRIIKEMDPRSPMQDTQTPFVNKGVEKSANAHWSALYHFSQFSNKEYDYKMLSPKMEVDLDTIARRVEKIIIPQSSSFKGKPLSQLIEDYKYWDISNNDGVYSGREIFTMNDREIISKDKLPKKKIKDYTRLMLQIALTYRCSDNIKEKLQLKDMFLTMLNYMNDQGWAYGSGLGALHHLGYNFKDFYSSCFLMRKEIRDAGYLPRTESAMYWFSGLGRALQKKQDLPHSNIDVFNTLLQGMLITVLMTDNKLIEASRMNAFSQWLSANMVPGYSIRGTIKVDGSIVHHATLYPAYGIGGVSGLSQVVYELHGTMFQVSDEAYHAYKKVLMTMHRYTNPLHWTISLSGRHPTGEWKINPQPFLYGALSAREGVDADLASAYIIMKNKPKDKWTLYFKQLGVTPKLPSGHWNVNYGLLDIHRREDWMLTVRGHNRYFISHESYPGHNMFGRYLMYGHLETLYNEFSSDIPSNFSDNGWDWNLIPGTTTLDLPLNLLRANILNVDDHSGVEEMLISEEVFAGGTTLDNQGLFSMKLRGHDKYDMGDFKAIKSYFMFDNTVICLGSNISNSRMDYPTKTTLFQNYLGDSLPNNKTYVTSNGNKISNATDINKWKGNRAVILDNRKIGYIIPNALGLNLFVGEQFSRDQKDSKDTKGFFETLTINHGKSPHDASYAYTMLINTNEKELNKFNKQVEQGKIYKIEQQDSIAHRLKYLPLNMSGLAIFEANSKIDDELVNQVDRPSLIMYKKNVDNTYRMAITDPDLAFYEGEEDSPRVNGKRQEVSIYSKSWYGTDSQPSIVKLILNGKWNIDAKEKEAVQKVEYSDNHTIVYVHCKYGLPTNLYLKKQ